MTDTTTTRHPSRASSAGLLVRQVLGVLLLLAIVAFAVDNRDDVRVGWVFGSGQAPLAVVLLITAVVGALVGWLLLHRPHRHHD